MNQNLNPTNNPNKICQVSEADQNKQQKEPQQFLLNEINFNNTDEYIRYIVNLYHKFDDEFEYKKNKMIKLPNSMLDFNKLLIQTKKQDDEINELLEKNIKAFKYLLTLYGNAIETCNKMETSMEGLYLEIESSIEGYLSQNN